jgi:DNA polymerase Ligase (LigD)
MPRFVILEHDHPFFHWDFMLEAGDVLRTWRLAHVPEHGEPIAATYLHEHRRLYLDYEGPLSGNRGSVRRWDAGVFHWLADDRDCVRLELAGIKTHGTAVLKRESGDAWTFVLTSTAHTVR